MRRLRFLAALPGLLLLSLLTSLYHDNIMCLALQQEVSAPATTFRIDSKTKIKDIFKCSGIHFIGSFNEYYVACELTVPNQQQIKLLEIVDVALDGLALSPLPGVHTELNFQLNTSLALVSVRNAQLVASAVEIRAANVSMDEHSAVNVSAQGLKFGPGYNSWNAMGGSYGGIGGASLTGSHSKCDDMPPNDFFRVVGDVSADSANFRGYGSGGGNDESRGGGRIRLVAEGNVEINGSLLANGGDACSDCYDSAGAGGSVVVVAKERIHGNATVQANGGEPSMLKGDEFRGAGGGGGGGGGRIVFDSKNAEELGPSRVEAYGGGLSSDKNAAIGWCQLGGDGTILKLQHTTKEDGGRDGSNDDEHQVADDTKTLVGTLLVKGGRLAHAGPVKRIQIYGCTPIFEQTSRGARFLPESLAYIFVSGGATVCASIIELKDSIAGVESSVVIDSGSELNVLDHEHMVRLSASQLTIQGYVGPSSLQERDLFGLTLIGSDVSFSNALAMVQELQVAARGAFSIDKFSELKFRDQVKIQTDASTKIEGFLQPLGKPFEQVRGDGMGGIPSVTVVSKKDVEFRPQTVEMGQVEMRIKANGTGYLDMPFDTPFLRLSISAANVSIDNVNSGPVLECKEIEHQADASACKRLRESTDDDDRPYSISIFASNVATLGNISAGSMILCSGKNMTIGGTISGSWLGCGSGVGPGKSEVAGEASGGAGHGGRGGNVLPGSTGGGAVYDISKELLMQETDTWMPPSSDKGWPIWPGSGAASGDTPNKLSGGAGGGIIYIGSKKLNVTKTASISAQGGVGSMGGGGGSGGALTLFVADIAGGGTIDLKGGAASVPTPLSGASVGANKSSIWDLDAFPGDDAGKIGGGGGGGIVRITYLDTADNSSVGNGEQFIKDGGHLSVDGGESTGGENGGNGVLVGGNCRPGRGGVFCLPCPEGSHSPGRFSKCSPCDPGTCSADSGAEKCDACSIGHFNPDFGKKECQACPLGSFGAKVGLKKCKLCPPGSFADLTGSSACSSCPIGSITTSSGNSNCTVCGIGQTTAKAGAIVCAACKNKPVHSEFNMRGNCSYACFKGRNGLDCLTPFERLVKPIGGPIGFVVLVFVVTGLIFGAWGFFSYRSSRSELRRYNQYKAQRLRDELSLETLTRTLTPRLTDQDLNAHVARLYLSGDNHLKSAWRLNPYFLPASLREIVEEGTYANFASTCNKLVEWDPAGWEAWLYRFLLVALPPVSTLFMRRRQLHRVVKLSKYIVHYGGRFFRDMNFRVHGTQLKVGFSSDFSLGYFDVLISQSGSSSSSNLVAMQTVNYEDLVLVVGGSGSFFRPYHLDTNDIIVRAIPSRLELLEHNFWIDFVADVNQKLRVLPQPSSAVRRVREAADVARDIIAFVGAFNEKHIKDGFAVTFGTFSVGGAIAADSNESCFEPFEFQTVDTTFASYPQEAFKLAFRVSRLNAPEASPATIEESRDSASDHSVSLDASPEVNDRVKAETDPRSADFRYSSIRMEALFAQPQRRSLGNDADDSSEDSDNLLKKPQKNTGAQRARALLEFLCTNDTAKRWLMALWQPVYPLFRLRNLPRPALPWLQSLTMVLLLIADMGVACWIIMEYYCVQIRDPTAQDAGCSRTALWSVLGILPAAIVGSPLLGLVFVTRKSIFCGKLFAVWNASSIVNQVVAFICGLAFLAYIHDEILLVAVGGVLIKYFEKEVALRCIAQYASERPLRGWRGLHTTRDWYDAAYTPLVHYES